MERKRLTIREKKERAEIKKEFQAKGILPPDKPKLNRKKYIEETMELWDKSVEIGYAREFYLLTALVMITTLRDRHGRVSSEAVGAAKVMRMCMRLFEFEKKIKEEGRTSYTYGEQYEYIKDILEE